MSKNSEKLDGIFTFDDILNIDDKKLRELIWKIDTKELSKALISESDELRKKFYRNMSLQSLQALDKDMMDTERFTISEKKNAQRILLKLIAKMPEHNKNRFENGFESLNDFEDYLLMRKPNDGNYGIFDNDVTMCRLDSIKNGEEILADIEQKNEEEKMGNIVIPNTKIKLINFSLCPTCSKIFSFKDLSNYYANPKVDIKYKNLKEQYRQDTRVYCNDCSTYFLPVLIISDGTPKSEIQFLCRIQTMQAIENYYQEKNGAKVLSQNKNNILEKKVTSTITDNEKTIVIAIRNDVFIKDMEEKPTLIANLLQYTPANIVMNVIDGSNFREKDVLFGVWG
jgi:hypothetical protein